MQPEHFAALIAELQHKPPDLLEKHVSSLVDTLDALEVEERACVLEPLCRVVGETENLRCSAAVAMALAEKVEEGWPPQPLARAVLEALVRWLPAAARVARATARLHGASGDALMEFGDKAVSLWSLLELWRADPQGMTAYLSLEFWWRAAVASWSRAPESIPEARRLLGESLQALEANSGNAHWLARLCGVSEDEVFVFVFPQLREAYEATLFGVGDVDQLLVLLSHALREPIGRVGGSEPASDAALAIANGEALPADEVSYTAQFHLYAWQSMDPHTRQPVDGRYRWYALGGYGTHALPPDFQPSLVDPLDGRRVVLVVGPQEDAVWSRAPRLVGGSRMFRPLRAEIRGVRQLTPGERVALERRLREAVVSTGVAQGLN